MTHPIARRSLLAGLAGSLATLPAWPQPAPSPGARTATIVIPFAPGASTDAVARMLADKLRERLMQPVIVDNKPGGNTLIATHHVRAQPPDGNTLYFTSSTAIEQPALRPGIANFDPVSDLTPIAFIGRMQFVLVVNPNLPVSNFAEFLQLAKTRPNGLSMGSIGIGSADHLASELIAQQTGAKLVNVPYKGTGAVLADVASGVLDGKFADVGSVRTLVEAGRLRVIASADADRVPGSPLVPIAETLPGVDVPVWFVLLGPRGMGPELVRQLKGHVEAILQMPDVAAQMQTRGIETARLSDDALRQLIRNRVEVVRQLVRDRGLKID